MRADAEKEANGFMGGRIRKAIQKRAIIREARSAEDGFPMMETKSIL
jgi:hypothetical protein